MCERIQAEEECKMEVKRMKKTRLVLSILALVLTFPLSDAYSATLDCAGGIISSGDRRADLLAKCGEPDSKESHYEEISERFDRGVGRKLFVNVEDWTYDFGQNQLQRIVTLKNGTVVNIRTGNYGYDKNAKPAKRECSEQTVSRGDLKSDVVEKCGEPTWKDSHEEEFVERLDSGVEVKRFVNVEEWTYDLGPNRFVRILTFKNGNLVDIKTGGYGYGEKQK
jgi:hypothetical protein